MTTDQQSAQAAAREAYISVHGYAGDWDMLTPNARAMVYAVYEAGRQSASASSDVPEDVAAVREEVSAILRETASGTARYWLEGHYIRWGAVEKDIQATITRLAAACADARADERARCLAVCDAFSRANIEALPAKAKE